MLYILFFPVLVNVVRISTGRFTNGSNVSPIEHAMTGLQRILLFGCLRKLWAKRKISWNDSLSHFVSFFSNLEKYSLSYNIYY